MTAMQRIMILLAAAAVARGAEMPPRVNADPAPVISDLTAAPARGYAGTRYLVTVRVADPRGPGDIRHTLYQLRQGIERIPLPINDAGVNGDAKAGDGIYTAVGVVPPSASPGTHVFEVFVKDRAGHRSNVLRYRFTVLRGAAI